MQNEHAWWLALCAALFAAALSGCSDCGGSGGAGASNKDDASLADGSDVRCIAAKFYCDGQSAMPCDPDADSAGVDCTEQGKTCNPQLGCVACEPGETSCEDGKATWCRDDGTLAVFECDPVQGLTCRPDGCLGECALNAVHDSYIGCEYYPTITLNPVWSGFAFAIAVSNASREPATVTITRGADEVAKKEVGAGKLEIFELPWVPALKGGDLECTTPPDPGVTRLAAGGSYRVRSDRPVTVYQFSPLEYELDPAPSECPVLSQCGGSESRCLSYSNDASLLLPTTALTGNYTVLSWPSQADGAGFIAITATEDGTSVTLHGAGKFRAGAGVDALGKGKVELDRGDVLELVAAGDSDVSGTRVRASKPVQVISGHSCANVPSSDTGTCDHIEEAMLPEDTLGREYVVTLPVYADLATSAPHVLRITAIEKGTKVRFDPEVVAPITLDAGEVWEMELDGAALDHVHVKTGKPALIATYMEGYQALPGSSILGDPSLALAVPIEQYRSDYLFTAPVTYAVNIADVVAKEGAHVSIDGVAIAPADFAPIGASGYGVAHVSLDHETSVHTLKADQEVGLTVYGYGFYTSYMYPGGADLERITVVPVL